MYIGLGVPIFIIIAGVAEETVISETFQVAVFDTEQFHQAFVVVDVRQLTEKERVEFFYEEEYSGG